MRPARPPRFDPTVIGWRLGRSHAPHGIELWCRYDRTAGVFGEQGSGKTLDVLAPALLAHRGAALATLTKVDDLLLTAGRRKRPEHAGEQPRPIAVLDPFGAAPGMPELIWDPIEGCVDPRVAERRAKAFAAGTVTGAVNDGRQDPAARWTTSWNGSRTRSPPINRRKSCSSIRTQPDSGMACCSARCTGRLTRS